LKVLPDGQKLKTSIHAGFWILFGLLRAHRMRLANALDIQ